MARAVNATWKSIIVDGAATPLQPRKQAGADVRRELELDGPAGLLLDDNRPGSDLGTGNDIAYPDLNEISATQLAIESEIEKRPIANPCFAIEEKPHRPNLLLREWSFGTDHLSCVPCRPVLHGGVEL